MSYTLTEPIEDSVDVGEGTTDADCGAGNPEPSPGHWSPSSVTEEPEDLIRGKEARFAAAASRRAMKKMLSKPRDDVEAG